MNYYNPYFNAMPYMNPAPKTGLFSRIFGGNVGLSSILSGTQKTLNIVNQTIPLIKQARPMFNNAKTMFRVMNEFQKVDTPKQNINKVQTSSNSVGNNTIKTEQTISQNNNNLPTFFAWKSQLNGFF